MDNLHSAIEQYEAETGFATTHHENTFLEAKKRYRIQRAAYHLQHPTERDLDVRVCENSHLLAFITEAQVSPLTAALHLLNHITLEACLQGDHDADDADYHTIMNAP